jgi:multidrug/hemolysin transport system permease protein
MKSILTLVKRNLLNYFYDPSAVFFSFLSVFILVGVYTLFLGTLQVNDIEFSVGEIEGIGWLVNAWLIAGLLTVTSFTVPLSISSNMVTDLEKRVFDDFLVAPIKRSSIVLGYVLSAFLIGVLMTSLTLMIGQLFLVLTGGEWLSVMGHVRILAYIVLSNLIFSSLSFLLISFIKSTASVNAVNTIVGTLLGFLAGIYVPFAAFSNQVSNVLKLNPAAQMVVLFRKTLMEGPMDLVFKEAPASVQENYKEVYGVILEIFDVEWTHGMIITYGLTFGAVMLGISIFRLNRYKK